MKEFKRDRATVCEIVGEMLDNLDDTGIYNTTECCQKLLSYIHQERVFALGWMHAFACSSADDNLDIRGMEVSAILDRAGRDLAVHPWEDEDEDTDI